MDIVIRPKNRFNGKKERDVQVVSQETWQQMQNNGLATRFIVVSQEMPNMDDKMQKIKDITAEIHQHSQPEFQTLLSEYRKAKKTDPEKAKEILLKAQELAPNNSYVKKEMKQYD